MKNIKILFENNLHDAYISLFRLTNGKELVIEMIIDYYDWDNNHSRYQIKYSKIEYYNIQMNSNNQYDPEIDNSKIEKIKSLYVQNISLHGDGLILIKFKKVKIDILT